MSVHEYITEAGNKLMKTERKKERNKGTEERTGCVKQEGVKE